MNKFKIYKPGTSDGHYNLLDKTKEYCKVCQKENFCKRMYHVLNPNRDENGVQNNPKQVCSKRCADMYILQNI